MPHSDLSSHVTRAADVIVDVACQEIGDRIACASGRVVTRVCDVAAQVQDGVRGSRSLSEASLIVMGVRDSAGLTSDLLVSRIRSALPNVSIFVCSSRAERGELRIRHYARAGADEFFFIDSPPDITALVDHAMARVEAPPPDAVLWNLAPGKPTLADMIALWCATRRLQEAHGGLCVRAVRNRCEDGKPALLGRRLRQRIRVAAIGTTLSRRGAQTAHSGSRAGNRAKVGFLGCQSVRGFPSTGTARRAPGNPTNDIGRDTSGREYFDASGYCTGNEFERPRVCRRLRS